MEIKINQVFYTFLTNIFSGFTPIETFGQM